MKTVGPRPGRPTGPRTPTGKAISSRNAWRHGLTLPIRADPLWRHTVIKLERAIADEEAPREVARLLAEGAVELSRIAHARATLVGKLDGVARLDTLRKLDRYEGRAYAKKRKAYRLLSCHRILGTRSHGGIVFG
jgi:hypothetical protein